MRCPPNSRYFELGYPFYWEKKVNSRHTRVSDKDYAMVSRSCPELAFFLCCSWTPWVGTMLLLSAGSQQNKSLELRDFGTVQFHQKFMQNGITCDCRIAPGRSQKSVVILEVYAYEKINFSVKSFVQIHGKFRESSRFIHYASYPSGGSPWAEKSNTLVLRL